MPLHYQYSLSLASNGYTPWFVMRGCSEGMLQIDVPATGSPVGVWTLEASNDLHVIENERIGGVLPANSAARSAPGGYSIIGPVLESGFDGGGARASMLTIWPLPGALRLLWTKTSGTGSAGIYLVAR